MSHPLHRSRLTAAVDLALKLHLGQTRKRSASEIRSAEGGETRAVPYVAHLWSVAALVLENGGSEDEVISALLHDGPEDQGGTVALEAIRLEFGPEVGEIVAGCSDTFEDPKPDWLQRKRAYLDHIAESDNEGLLLVSIADKVHNLRSILADYEKIGCRVWERFNQGRDGTLWYYASLLEIFEARSPSRCRGLLGELESAFSRLIDRVEADEGAAAAMWSGFADSGSDRAG